MDTTGTATTTTTSTTSGQNTTATTTQKCKTKKTNHPPPPHDFFRTNPLSTRSPVVCRNAAVACSQPLAARIGIELLSRHQQLPKQKQKTSGSDTSLENDNGAALNAADVAIAMAAAIAVLEPCSTGIGGDMFCLYYEHSTGQVTCINGSGRSPEQLTLERVMNFQNRNDKQSDPNYTIPTTVGENFWKSSLSITVPGAPMGWQNLYDKYGSKHCTFLELLEPAIQLATDGFPVAPITAHSWQKGFSEIQRWYHEDDNNNNNETTTTTKTPIKYPLTTENNVPPQPGDIVQNIDLANVLREIGTKGAYDGYYNNWVGEEIVKVIQKHGGCLTLEDMRQHTDSTYPTPIYVDYRHVRLWQVPPNGQGIAGLIALAGIQYLEESKVLDPITPMNIGSTNYYHAVMEMMRLGFADARAYVADPEYMTTSCTELLKKERIQKRIDELYNPDIATIQGLPDASSCTISFQVVDTYGNAISFVNSNFTGFGTGMVPNNCGFPLQNRGNGFNLIPNHPNCVGPKKLPFHSIIPGMITYNNNNNKSKSNDQVENDNQRVELYATISNMGGHMQPQGHVQLLLNLVAGEMNPQQAIDYPRFCIADGSQHGVIQMECGIQQNVIDELINDKGHRNLQTNVTGYDRNLFGRAQIIQKNPLTGVLWAGSDGRSDGCAMGF